MNQMAGIIKRKRNKVLRLIQYWTVSLCLFAAATILPYPPVLQYIAIISAVFHFFICIVLAFIPIVLIQRRKTAFLVSIAITSLGYLLETISAALNLTPFNAVNALANNIGVLAGISLGLIVRLNNHYEQKKAQLDQCIPDTPDESRTAPPR
jgi:hypothetical protein